MNAEDDISAINSMWTARVIKHTPLTSLNSDKIP